MKLPLKTSERYALLVVDMQRDGLEPGGAIFVEGGLNIVDNIQELTTAARSASWPVIHTQHVHRQGLSDFGISAYFEAPNCLEGSTGMDFIPQMTPDSGDLVVQKRRYDAFEGTELDLILRHLAVEGLMVC